MSRRSEAHREEQRQKRLERKLRAEIETEERGPVRQSTQAERDEKAKRLRSGRKLIAEARRARRRGPETLQMLFPKS